MATDTTVEETKYERRTMINFTVEQHEWLRKEAFRRRMSMSELVRLALSAMIGGEQAKTG